MIRKITIALVVILILGSIIVGCSGDTRAIEGTVVDIHTSAGGFGSSSIATVYFDTGDIIPFRISSLKYFKVGHHYKVVCHYSGFQEAWLIDEIDEIDEIR